ncbi:hypothetical protein [Aquibacillus saliphilus]|uniref:hypothetical protein n=1 Tax=Aquibacillus saliphilus TaxID=1909422 RepID=UPI001CF092E6|nr:hypothetical protein [Aquibacillus saliphilus]
MDKVKQKLDKELNQIQFSSKQQVLNNSKNKWNTFFNKQIEIPLVPVTGVAIIFITLLSIYPITKESPSLIEQYPAEGQIVEKGGSIYWESWFNEVRQHES